MAAILADILKNIQRIETSKHVNAISLHGNDMGRTIVVKHAIDTGTALPIRQSLRRIPQCQAKAVDNRSCKRYSYFVGIPG